MDGMTENEETPDLGATIDERLQVGITSGRIVANALKTTALLTLLIENKIITADEFTEKLNPLVKSFLEEAEKTKNTEEFTAQGLSDIDRFVTTITQSCENTIKKISENN